MKIKKISRDDKPILLIGPSPPPFGGARVSFKLFFDFLKNYSNAKIRYFDLPHRSKSSYDHTGKVNHFKTGLIFLRVLLFLPFCHSIIIFGSRGFCFSYGVIVCMMSRILRKDCYLRFFGGRPVPHLQKFPNVFRKIIFWGLKSAKKISIATKIGALEFPEVLRKKFEIIPGYRPVTPLRFPSQRDRDNTFRFAYVGAISKEKGIDILLKSFSILQIEAKDKRVFELHLYGGEAGYPLEKLVKADGVYYHGQIDNIELRRQLVSYDTFVFPSVYDNEGHPGVLIEALMAGLPIISSDKPVIREFLYDNFNCLLVKPGDIEGLYKAMDKLIKDSALREKISKAALETSSLFDAANVLPELANVFEL